MPFVKMGSILNFSSNNGVILESGALDVSPEKLYNAVKTAFSHLHDKLLLDACCGGRGPLADVFELSYEEYLEALKQYENEMATQEAKRIHTKIRRAYFNSSRAQVVLMMIEAGVPHVCAEPTCGVHEGLTVDHIVPISRGGSDEISNLRFLCTKHNSSKADKMSW
ncbi:MAG: HNH endonuclease [Terracidiphilus sp.]